MPQETPLEMTDILMQQSEKTARVPALMHRSEENSRATALNALSDSIAEVHSSCETQSLLCSSKKQPDFKQPRKRMKPIKS